MHQKMYGRYCGSRRFWKNKELYKVDGFLFKKMMEDYVHGVAQRDFLKIPGKDFTENHSPVLHDTIFHTILVLNFLIKLESGQFDIETAFLYGELEESLWMVFPEGYTEFLEEKQTFNGKRDPEIYCLKLKKSIYGLVQAARQWWKKF
jgi:hypothetical protein